jgi:transglutaminase-like putative cysteine protease
MKRILIVLPLLLLCTIAIAQNNYDVSLIPKELLPYASAVVRNEEITTEVKDLDNMTYHVKRAVTVLNKNGDDIAHMAVFYNKNTSVKYIKGTTYNEFGKLIGKFNEHDFLDESTGGNSTLFQDYRVKHYIPSVTQYPYTIEYEYELKYRQTLNIEDWEPVPQPGLAVEKSSYKFISKPDFNIRYKEINIQKKAEITTDGKLITYTWQLTNKKALKNEPFSPNWRVSLSRVMIAPEKFSYYGIEGAFTNWQELGKWEYDKLLANRQDVPAETAEHIKQITAGIADPKLKAKKIYEYMQQKTHYISIQIGIGGYQPFPASDVDKLNYGDCKALVNYALALLKVAGIDSYYCVVYGNHKEKISMLNDFASMQGNHAILCIPFKNDTTWLECTSQQIPFGFLSDFTDDRTVLACTPEGGKLMHTPKYTTEENLEKRKANFVLTETGELMGNMETVFKGTDYDDRYRLIEEAPVERIKDIKKYYPINNLEIEKLEFKQDKSIKPVTTENIKLLAREYGAVNNGKVYFSLNSVDRTSALRQVQNRVNPIYINRGYTEEDEITYTLPKGYRLDSEPLRVSIEKPFGNFSTTMTINGNQLVYKRKFQLKDGAYSKDTYQDMVDFYQTVADADDYNVTLVKN